MNYIRIYENIIKNAKRRVYENGIFEIHHIIPKTLGGEDDEDNLVRLTYKEHRIVHLLLWRSFSDHPDFNIRFRMLMSYRALCVLASNYTKYRNSGKSGFWYRLVETEYKSGISRFVKLNYSSLTEDERKKFGRDMKGENNPMYGRKHNEETKTKIGIKSIERDAASILCSDEVRDKARKSMNDKFGCDYPMQSKDIQDKIRNSIRNKYGVDHISKHPDVKKKISESKRRPESALKYSGGWVITPVGKYPSFNQAGKALNMDTQTLKMWCTNKNLKTGTALAHSKAGVAFSRKLSFRELGYGFEKVKDID